MEASHLPPPSVRKNWVSSNGKPNSNSVGSIITLGRVASKFPTSPFFTLYHPCDDIIQKLMARLQVFQIQHPDSTMGSEGKTYHLFLPPNVNKPFQESPKEKCSSCPNYINV
jgi:hypothetical protein